MGCKIVVTPDNSIAVPYVTDPPNFVAIFPPTAQKRYPYENILMTSAIVFESQLYSG